MRLYGCGPESQGERVSAEMKYDNTWHCYSVPLPHGFLIGVVYDMMGIKMSMPVQ